MLDEGVVKTLFSLSVAAARAPRDRTSMRQQRGAIAVMAAIGLSVAVILLSSIDIGHLFYKKRDLQKIVDLAALAGATKLTGSSTCTSTAADLAILTATQNASVNANVAPTAAFPGTLQEVSCGYWVAGTYAPYVAGQPVQNAVKVVASESVQSFFGLATQLVSAQAIATAHQPIAAFSIGTGLLSLCSSASPLLAPLLNGLLGSSVCLSAVTYNGLLGTQVSLLSVLLNLGLDVGDINQVLTTKITLAQFINATINALSPSQVAKIDVAELQTLAASPLGGKLLTIGDILKLNAADQHAALDTQVNVLDLLNVGTLQVANRNNFIDLGANIDLGVLGKVGLQLKLIEPPQMAIGGPGTVATSAQLRLWLIVKALTLAPGYSVAQLPLFIDLAPGKATLQSLQCTAPKSATFDIQPGVAEVCLAKGVDQTSAPFSCPDITKPTNRVEVVSGVLNLGIKADLTNPIISTTLNEPLPSSVTVGSSLASILGNIISPSTISAGLVLPDPLHLLDGLLTAVLSGLGLLLNPILSAVGALLDTVLSLLGIGVGQSTLNLMSIDCGGVKLVQ